LHDYEKKKNKNIVSSVIIIILLSITVCQGTPIEWTVLGKMVQWC